MSSLLVFIISTGHKKPNDAWSKKLKRSTNYWKPVDLYSSETFKTTTKKDWHGSLYYRPKQCTIKDKSFKLPCFCINFDVPQKWVPLDDPKSFKFTKNLSYPFFIRFNLVRCFRDNVASHPEREMPSRKRTTSAFGVEKIRSHNLKKTQKNIWSFVKPTTFTSTWEIKTYTGYIYPLTSNIHQQSFYMF